MIWQKQFARIGSRQSFVLPHEARLLRGTDKIRNARLLSDDLHQDSLPSSPIELVVEDVLPGAQMQPAFRNCQGDFAPHHLPLQMGIRVVFSRSVMVIPLW